MADPAGNQSGASDPRVVEAIQAVDRGWALIPLKGKKPIQTGWTTAEAATIDQVLRWLRAGHNLGLRTGAASDLVVIDDDSPDGTASAKLNLPPTVTVETGSGKLHLYFRRPVDLEVRNSAKTLWPGIDIRGDGGQVVFPGSIHPETGKPYRWAPGLSPTEVAIAELPDHILERIREASEPKRPLRIVDDSPQEPKDQEAESRLALRLVAYAQAALDAEISNVLTSAEGQRNDTLNKAAFALGQLVGADALDRDTAVNSLLNAATSAGLTESEAKKTINSGLRSGITHPRDLASAMKDSSEPSPDAVAIQEDDRPEIAVIGGWLHRVTSRAERILLQQTPPIAYQRGTSLVRICAVTEPGSGRSIRRTFTIQPLTLPALIDRLTGLIHWKRFDKKSKDFVAIDCPEKVAQTLLSRSGSWALPALTGIIGCPTLRSDGGILDREGYDRSSGLYVALGGQRWPRVPVEPTQEQVDAALQTLLEPISEFPFLEPVDRSVALAAILTALIRPSIRTAPLIAFRAAKMGSGKSLLADVVSLIATGRPGAVMSQGADENEDKKRMLPILAEGDPVAVIDNIERPFGSAALCSILTQTTWRDRVLGKSQTMTLPTTNTTWLATGNNVVFAGDISTRTLVCDLDPGCEHPEQRRFEVNLHEFIPTNRGRLVVAGLTLLRAYHVAGRPDQDLPVFGRFEEWSAWIRSTLVWLGMPDPCETRKRIEEVDPVRGEIAELLAELHGHFGDEPFRVADVLAAQDENTALRQVITPILTQSGSKPDRQSLGLQFQRVNRRPEGGRRLVRTDSTRNGSRLWRIERV